MKRFLILCVSLFVSLFLSKVHADEGWTIDSFHSDIVIQSTGEVVVAEDIEVDFGSLEKHGIFRDIPYVYKNEDGEIYTKIKVNALWQDGGGAKYQVSRNDNNIRIKVGDPNKTISGKHNYEISYTVKGVLKRFEEHDEFYWNVTGNGWDVPIQKASAIVSLPENGIQKTACFQGYEESREPCDAKPPSLTKGEFFVTRPLGTGEGLTIVTGYTKGLVPILRVDRPKTFIEKLIELPSLATLLSITGFGVATVVFVWHRKGRDYSLIRKNILDTPTGEAPKALGSHETIVVEYMPPVKLRPAEIGVLVDERADTLDVVATIIDLAAKGYMTITEVPKSWIFGKVDYLLIRKDGDVKDLLGYEKELLDKLFLGKQEVKVSSLKQTFYTDLKKVKDLLYARVVSAKLFPANPEKVRSIYIVVAVGLLALGIFAVINSISRDIVYVADVGIGVVITAVILLVFSPFMSRRTGQGRELFRRVRGYRLFIETAEKHRQRFFEKKNLFNEVLPYAIVFGLTEKFAQAMKEIGLPEKQLATGWYYGAHPFHYSSFSSSMSDFSKSLSTAIASSPKSSGFSSSGGSSGGGFGGGGGGSW